MTAKTPRKAAKTITKAEAMAQQQAKLDAIMERDRERRAELEAGK